MTRQDYSDRQISAPLVICAKCGKGWYMTQPQAWCLRCRQTKGDV